MINRNNQAENDARRDLWLAWYRYLARIGMEIEQELAQQVFDPMMLGHVIDVLITANGGELE